MFVSKTLHREAVVNLNARGTSFFLFSSVCCAHDCIHITYMHLYTHQPIISWPLLMIWTLGICCFLFVNLITCGTSFYLLSSVCYACDCIHITYMYMYMHTYVHIPTYNLIAFVNDMDIWHLLFKWDWVPFGCGTLSNGDSSLHLTQRIAHIITVLLRLIGKLQVYLFCLELPALSN